MLTEKEKDELLNSIKEKYPLGTEYVGLKYNIPNKIKKYHSFNWIRDYEIYDGYDYIYFNGKWAGKKYIKIFVGFKAREK